MSDREQSYISAVEMACNLRIGSPGWNYLVNGIPIRSNAEKRSNNVSRRKIQDPNATIDHGAFKVEPLNEAWQDITVDSTVMCMPWGKYRGTPIDRVPRDYLTWCVHNADAMKDDLRAAMEDQLGLRPGSTRKDGSGTPVADAIIAGLAGDSSPVAGDTPTPQLDEETLRAAFRTIEHLKQIVASKENAERTLRASLKMANDARDELNREITRLSREVSTLRSQVADLNMRASRPANPAEGDTVRRAIKQAFAAMSRRFHPDHNGGNPDKQTVVNIFYNEIMGRL